MLQRVYDAGYVFLDLAGTAPAASGTIYFYENNTTTLTTVFSDTSGTESANPLTLGADGRLPNDVYVNGSIRVRVREYHITPASGTIVFTKDNQPSVGGQQPFYVSDYGAILDGSTDDLDAFNDAVTAAANSTLIIDGPIKLSDNVTVAATVHVIAQGTITMAAGKYFTALLFTHQKEKYTSGFNDWYDIRAFGGVPDDPTYSNTAVWNAIMPLIPAKKLNIPNGVWYFNTKPTEATAGPSIYGGGISTCWLARNYTEGGGDEVPFIGFKGASFNGHVIQDIGLYAWTGTTGGTMLKFICNTDEAAGFNKVIRVFISYNGGQYKYGYICDGSPNNTGGAKGWRACYYEYLYVFVAPSTGLAAIKLMCNGGAFGSMVSAGKMILNGLSGNYTGVTLQVNCIAEIACDYVLGTLQGTADTITTTANTALGFEFNGLLTAGVGSNLGASAAATGVRISSRRTQSKGSSLIANGATSSGAINHGLGNTPTAAQIHVTQTITTTNDSGNLYVDTITSSQFTVKCRSDPGASTLTFDWYCDLSI